jgi:hypothetical protein
VFPLGDGVISFHDLVCGLSVLWKGTQAEKVEYAFSQVNRRGPSDADERPESSHADPRSGWMHRDELRALFSAHFMLSMAMVQVRDVTADPRPLLYTQNRLSGSPFVAG